jgi:hypothetical protein
VAKSSEPNFGVHEGKEYEIEKWHQVEYWEAEAETLLRQYINKRKA